MAATDAESCRLDFDGRLTIRTIDTLCTRLRDALDQYDEVALDCRAAEDVDITLIQLLLAAHRSVGARIRLVPPLPAVLRDALERGGFLAGDDAAHPLWLDGTASQ